MTERKADVLPVPGASLYYEVRGSGPLLLILAGGDGGANASDLLVEQLAGHYAVVTYDRRGLSRSTRQDEADNLDLTVHADDAARILESLTDEPADVLGFSIGALIGLDLAARYPARVRRLVAHEPPLTQLLPEADRTQAVQAQQAIEDTYRDAGLLQAMQRFGAMTQLSFDDREPGVELPRPSADRATNLNFFLTHDAPAARRYRADPDQLKALAGKIQPAAGTTSRNIFPHKCAVRLAELLGTPLAEFPGGHSGFLTHPQAFATVLRRHLDSPAA
ncbi:alpha/beta fold hydrolase [Kribbella sp. NPDC006257]|uniref:alpha/beta fold hydrolase n=1 Tax=Kribbella sp. NPDC006257 TaxID=3156738 RepID=UPI0033AD49D8